MLIIGKSTLADRILELVGAIDVSPDNKQVRERGDLSYCREQTSVTRRCWTAYRLSEKEVKFLENLTNNKDVIVVSPHSSVILMKTQPAFTKELEKCLVLPSSMMSQRHI